MQNIIHNMPFTQKELEQATKILDDLNQELVEKISQGHGPFLAALYDAQGNCISKEANSVVLDQCSHCHAEMNAIKSAEKKYNTFDLSTYDLALYTTSEPCIMCLGGILWSGIKKVYFSVPSSKVEEITGFDEGFKPNWLEEFKARGIKVVGNISSPKGEQVLKLYVEQQHTIYKPSS